MILRKIFGWSKDHQYHVGNSTQPFNIIRKDKTVNLRCGWVTLVEFDLKECKEPHTLVVRLQKEFTEKFGVQIVLDVDDLLELCR